MTPVPLLGRARRLWGRLQAARVRRRMAGPKLLRAFADAYPRAFFIEIGANDGLKHDHLRPFVRAGKWHGLMVEPVPFVFERLRRNCETLSGVTPVNAAIAERDGTLPFHHLAEAAPEERDSLPGWYDAIGSFSRERVLAHAREVPDIERRLVTRAVECLSFESLCRRYAVGRVDLLAIDAEGHDGRIVRELDLEARRPRLLLYEHYHLEPAERTEIRTLLDRAGYATMEEGFDTFCLDMRPDDSLSHAWRRLRPGVAGVSVHDEKR